MAAEPPYWYLLSFPGSPVLPGSPLGLLGAYFLRHPNHRAAYQNSWAQGWTAKANKEHNRDLIRPYSNRPSIRLLVSAPGLFHTQDIYTSPYGNFSSVVVHEGSPPRSFCYGFSSHRRSRGVCGSVFFCYGLSSHRMPGQQRRPQPASLQQSHFFVLPQIMS